MRGRVGRSNRRAYAYLLVPQDTELSEIARKRLAALREFSDLGAGFKIAALDLELRGAGNLLGGEQHGHIASVGFDTYLRLLEETVRELKGEETPLEIHSSLNLGLDIRIPPEYIADENQRLRAYKRVADANDAEKAEKVRAELADRYGPLPEAVETLVRFALLKTQAAAAGIEAIDRRAGRAAHQVSSGFEDRTGAVDGAGFHAIGRAVHAGGCIETAAAAGIGKCGGGSGVRGTIDRAAAFRKATVCLPFTKLDRRTCRQSWPHVAGELAGGVHI